mgnify:FL=1
MSTKHTPGPWRFFDNAGSNMQGYSQPSGVAGTGENLGQLICGCFGDVRGGEEQASANARLIAAAPDLLAALQLLQDAALPISRGGDVLDEKGFNTLAHPISVALAAISKATQP